MIKKQEVKTFIERLFCECGKEMKATGSVFYTYPLKYEYSCECGKKDTEMEQYPKITYEAI